MVKRNKDFIILNKGSIQNITDVPKTKLYKHLDLSQKALIDLAQKEVYVCQSQSLNLFIQDPTVSKLSSNFYAWSKGLKLIIICEHNYSSCSTITIDPKLKQKWKKNIITIVVVLK